MTATEKIKAQALALGFSAVGIAKAERLNKEADLLERWLAKGLHGEMRYMEDHFEKRVNPTALVPNAKSVLSVIANYFTPEKFGQAEKGKARISAYAQSEDYHLVLKRKLNELFEFVLQTVGEVNGRAFVDSAPMLDKAWAERAGLGWIGKHTNLITREHGSYFFIGSLVLDCELDDDTPYAHNYCGRCTACIDLCPTQAIIAPYQVDARKCISYLTIELKREFSEEEQTMLGEWLFGCDVCQEVCPWNRFSQPTAIKEFAPKQELNSITESEILEMTKSAFAKVFDETPVFRTGLRRLKRNALAVGKNRMKKN